MKLAERIKETLGVIAYCLGFSYFYNRSEKKSLDKHYKLLSQHKEE